MADFNAVAVALLNACEAHCTSRCGEDRRTGSAAEIETSMEGPAPGEGIDAIAKPAGNIVQGWPGAYWECGRALARLRSCGRGWLQIGQTAGPVLLPGPVDIGIRGPPVALRSAAVTT
jgi:hypothetical protein